MVKISRAGWLNLALRVPGGLLCAAAMIALALDAVLISGALALGAWAWLLLWIGVHELFCPAINQWVRDEPD